MDRLGVRLTDGSTQLLHEFRHDDTVPRQSSRETLPIRLKRAADLDDACGSILSNEPDLSLGQCQRLLGSQHGKEFGILLEEGANLFVADESVKKGGG